MDVVIEICVKYLGGRNGRYGLYNTRFRQKLLCWLQNAAGNLIIIIIILYIGALRIRNTEL
jgi:hypothetical protein